MGINEFEYLRQLFEEKFNHLCSDIDELKQDFKQLNVRLDEVIIENAQREITCPHRKSIYEMKRKYDYEEESKKKFYRNIGIVVSVVTIIVNIVLKYVKW